MAKSDRQQAEERALLAEFALNRNPAVRERLAEMFAPLAFSLASRYRHQDRLEDLRQVAMIGLLLALDRYEPDGGRFQAFAAATILGELRHHVRDRVNTIRISRQDQDLLSACSSFSTEFAEQHGREPTIKELAQATGASIEKLLHALEAKEARSHISLDAPVGDEDGSEASINRVGSDDGGYERIEASLDAQRAGLTAREIRVLRMYYGGAMKQRDIGSKIGVSQMQVSRIARGGLGKLLAAVQGSPGERTHA